MHLTTIAHIHTDFREKFGTPRQAGLLPDVVGRIVFTPEYRNPDFLRGSRTFLTSGFSGASHSTAPSPHDLPFVRHAWEVTAAWVSLPPVHPIVPIP